MQPAPLLRHPTGATAAAARRRERRQPASSSDGSAASAAAPPLLTHWLPISVLTDSYKTTHFMQYPPCEKMVAVSSWLAGWCREGDGQWPCGSTRAAGLPHRAARPAAAQAQPKHASKLQDPCSPRRCLALVRLPPLLTSSTESCGRGMTRTLKTRASSSTACGTSWKPLWRGDGRCRRVLGCCPHAGAPAPLPGVSPPAASAQEGTAARERLS